VDVEQISDETMRRELTKRAQAASEAAEDVLEVYHRPYSERRPLVCLDEVPVQLVGESRTPLPAAPGRPARHD
jgi:hypothetical protein